ncbi:MULTISPECIES: MoaD/ThiS family protein [Antrihabitans]|jgi:sulfur-carrier protein|uniref:MoaD/ThiS family protein n=2 Tax=Antrihabitans TaxID=2799491 RepID=A0A934NNB9_9NOCA|nr:MoaD/ThiS family protein [Antrihabitans stalagmiti]MBJ8338364.1 MoaD/ThiS family protein [Antrihabitans stalagmiti]
MAVTVTIPTVLRRHTGGVKLVEASGSTVAAVLADLESRYASLEGRIASDGKLHRFVNVYVDDNDVRNEQGLDTEVKEGSAITILSAMAGGA